MFVVEILENGPMGRNKTSQKGIPPDKILRKAETCIAVRIRGEGKWSIIEITINPSEEDVFKNRIRGSRGKKSTELRKKADMEGYTRRMTTA